MASKGLSWLLEVRVRGDWEAALFSELEVGQGMGHKGSSGTSHQSAGSCDLTGL